MDLKEQLHIVGCIVYDEQLTPQLKRTAQEMFMDMDIDGDNSVTLQELTAHCDPSMRDFVRKMFRLLDVDNSGFLDFDECKALFFLKLCNDTWGNSAWRCCDSCSVSVLDSIYTCSACLSQENVYFDLCSNCYPDADHDPAHRSQFERHDLKVAAVIDAILTQYAEEEETPTSIVTHNHYYINSNAEPPGRSNSANATSRNGLVRTTTRRLTQALSFASCVATVATACSIM